MDNFVTATPETTTVPTGRTAPQLTKIPGKRLRINAEAAIASRPTRPDADVGERPGDFVVVIEMMDRTEAIEAISAFTGKLDEACFILGGLLSKVHREKWFAPHENLEAFADAEFGIGGRTARYLIEIYDKFRELELPVDQFVGVGWTKIRMVMAVLTKENAAYWAKTAAENSRQLLQRLVQASISESVEQRVPRQIKGHKARLLEGIRRTEAVQVALEIAKRRFGVEDDAEAIEQICIDYASAALPHSIASLEPEAAADVLTGMLRKFGKSAVSAIIGKVLADFDLVLTSLEPTEN